MPSLASSWPRHNRHRLLGLLIAALVVASQIAGASVIWPDDAAQRRMAALDALSVMCRGGHPTPLPHTPLHRSADPSLCPAAASLAVPLALLAAGAPPPAPPPPLRLRAFVAAPIRAPPLRGPGAAYPRGPPALA